MGVHDELALKAWFLLVVFIPFWARFGASARAVFVAAHCVLDRPWSRNFCHANGCISVHTAQHSCVVIIQESHGWKDVLRSKGAGIDRVSKIQYILSGLSAISVLLLIQFTTFSILPVVTCVCVAPKQIKPH